RRSHLRRAGEADGQGCCCRQRICGAGAPEAVAGIARTPRREGMRSMGPPRLARWLLSHLGSSGNNDALIGDLDERYRAGRSWGWYWKQAIVAIVLVSARPLLAGGLVFWFLLNALFPVLGRCTVLMCIAGLPSGLTVSSLSTQGRWLKLFLSF